MRRDKRSRQNALRKRKRVFGVVALILGGLFGIVTWVPNIGTAYTPHAPILIDGNANFTAANGVTGGSGTPGDPYLIEGWDINASTAHGIEIRNADAHLVVRGVFLHSGSLGLPFPNYGLALNSANNVTMENVTTSDNGVGVLISASDNITVDRLTADEYGRSIYVSGASNVSIRDSALTTRNYNGVELSGSRNVLFTGNTITLLNLNSHGIHIEGPGNQTIQNNTITNGDIGIYAEFHETLTVAGNAITASRGDGIELKWGMDETRIMGNNIIGNGGYGIRINSPHVNLTGNNVSNNGGGIRIDSTNASLSANVFWRNGVVLKGTTLESWDSHIVAADNWVNGHPLLYYRDCAGISLDGVPAGQVIAANCTGVRIRNLHITDTDIAIQVGHSRDVEITGNLLAQNRMTRSYPIYTAGILTDYTVNLTVSGNNFTASDKGIEVQSGYDLMLLNNTFSDLEYGVEAYSLGRQTISGNYVSDTHYGISVGATEVWLENNTVTALDGITVSWSDNFTALRNRVRGGFEAGMYLFSLNAGNVIGNCVYWNGGRGVVAYPGNTLVAYQNTFIDNNLHAEDGSSFIWDDGYPVGGNFWSGYPGVDLMSGSNQDIPGSDGIGDTPYWIDADSQDKYPLMSPGCSVFPNSVPPVVKANDAPDPVMTNDFWGLRVEVVDDLGALSQVVLNVTDSMGGVIYNGGMTPISAHEFEYDYYFTVPGVYNYEVWAVDFSGNWGSDSGNVTVVLTPDLAPPFISAILVNGDTFVFANRGDLVVLTAILQDASDISGAWFDVNGGPWNPMFPTDGAFDSPVEWANATIDTAGWSAGTYEICVYGRDVANNTGPGNWNVFIYLSNIDAAPPLVTNLLLDGQPNVTIPRGAIINVTAIANDTSTGGSNIAGAWATVDFMSWGPPAPLDGIFDEPIEVLVLSLDTSALGGGTHVVCLYAEDEAGNWNFAGVCGNFTLVGNAPPMAVIDVSPGPAGFIGDTFTFWGDRSSDLDGTVVTWEWDFGDGKTGSGISTTHAYSARFNYVVTLNATDDQGAWDTATLNVLIVNRLPLANAGPDQPGLSRNAVVTLDGSGSTDPDADLLTFSWTQTAGPTVVLTGATTATPSFTPTAVGTYTFELTVDDGLGGTDVDDVTVTVVNRVPTADAGPDRPGLHRNLPVTLNGTGSTDPDGDALAFSWTQTAGPTVVLTGGNTATPSFTPTAAATYTFELTVDDGLGGTDVDDVTVTVVNRAPVADVGGPYTCKAGETITFDGSGSTDPDGDVLTYQWTVHLASDFTLFGRKPTFTCPATEGAFTVSLRVNDPEPLFDFDVVQLSVHPKGEAAADWTWLIVVLIAVMAILLILFLLIRRRRRGEEKQEEPKTELSQPPQHP